MGYLYTLSYHTRSPRKSALTTLLLVLLKCTTVLICRLTTTPVRTVLCCSRREIILISLRLTVPNRQVMGPRRMSCGTGLTPCSSKYCSIVVLPRGKLSLVWVPCTIRSLYIKAQPSNDSTETPPRRNLLFHLLHLIYHDGSNLSKEQPLRRRLPFRSKL